MLTGVTNSLFDFHHLCRTTTKERIAEYKINYATSIVTNIVEPQPDALFPLEFQLYQLAIIHKVY